MATPPHERRQPPSMAAIMEPTTSNTAAAAATSAAASADGAEATSHEPKLPDHRTPSDHEPPLLPPQPQPPCIPVDPVAERRLVRKLDLIMLPFLLAVSMISFVDRIAMKNTKAQGLMGDLQLTVKEYDIAYYICFASLVLFGVPSILLFMKCRPSWYLGGLMVCWGVVNLAAGFVQTFHGLVALRFLLGIFQAGLQPGVIYLTSLYYTRYEYQKRLSLLFCGNLAASAFGPLLAYAIGKGIAGVQTVNPKNSSTTVVTSIASNGFKGWRWVFIVEGSFTAALGLLACVLIVDEPARCRYLSADERRLLQERMLAADANDGRGRRRGRHGHSHGHGHGSVRGGGRREACTMDRLDLRAVLRILADYKIWLGSLVCIGMGTTAHSTAMFMSSILHDFGYKSRDVQLHTLPVYAVAAAFMLAVAWLSDRLRLRYAFIMAGTVVATIGYCMLLDETWMNREAKYGASFLIGIGGYATLPIAFGWLVDNLAGRWKRAIGIAIQSALGNMAGVVASNIYVAYERPAYLTGYGVALGLLWMGALAATALAYLIWEENRRRDLGGRAARLRQPPEVVANLGDDHPAFRYTI